jgi:hypothetical protein
MNDWLSRLEKDMKDAAKRDVFNLWLACHTQEEIAAAVGWPKPTINAWLHGMVENGKDTESDHTSAVDTDDSDSPLTLSKAELAAADHATDFTAPIYNIWKQQDVADGRPPAENSPHPGRAGRPGRGPAPARAGDPRRCGGRGHPPPR